MEKGPTRKHDKKRNIKVIVTPQGSPDHEPIGEVPEPEAQNATPPPQLAGPSQPTQWTEKEGKEQVKTLPEKGVAKDSSSPTASFER